MNIEELTKSQIFLLTVLTSFVTSIATGIVTVSLIDQTPQTITQSVSRVIQATVEKATPPSKGSQPVAAVLASPLQPAPTAPEKPRELSEIIQGALPSVVRIYTANTEEPLFLGFGIALDAGGTIVSDSHGLGLAKRATVTLSDGISVDASVIATDSKSGLIFLSAASSSAPVAPKYTPALFSKETPALGQSVIAVFGKSVPRIASGLVVALIDSGAGSSTPPFIGTNIDATSLGNATPIFDVNGAFMGISTALSRAAEASAFIPVSIISSAYDSALQPTVGGLKRGGN